MYAFIHRPFAGRSTNPIIDYVLTHANFSARNKSGYSMGNYDSDDDDYDPDEDLRMMFDDEDYDEMHEG